MTRRTLSLALLVATVLAPWGMPAHAQSRSTPRFATLDAAETNIRTGPGWQYPVDWVYLRRDLPIEVIAEYDVWRKIRDWQGVGGWVHGRLLSGRRSIIIVGEALQPLRAERSLQAPIVARMEPGVIGRLLNCPQPAAGDIAADDPNGWCYADFDGHRGWISRRAFWGGAYPEEVVD